MLKRRVGVLVNGVPLSDHHVHHVKEVMVSCGLIGLNGRFCIIANMKFHICNIMRNNSNKVHKISKIALNIYQ